MINNIKHQGFSLIELMITISIMGILLAIGAPSLKRTVQDNNMATLHNELLAALSFTRNTAINKGSPATFCKANNTWDGCSAVTSWGNGWIVFSDKNKNGVVNTGETILLVKNDLAENIAINKSGNANRITYSAQGYAVGYSGKFTFCDSRGDSARKGMVLSNNGRVRIAAMDELTSC